jgi:flagellar export protein FliJ
MKRTLERVVRLRALLESLAQAEFRKRSAALQELESAAGEQQRLGHQTRAQAVRELTAAASHAGWRISLADAAILSRRQAGLETLARNARPALSQARHEFLTRRIDRRQAEILEARAARADEKEQLHREQNRLDDWFQSRSARGNSRST